MRLPNGILATTMSHKTDYPTPAAFQGHFGPWPGGGQEQSGRDMPAAEAATAVARLDSSRFGLGKLFPPRFFAASLRLSPPCCLPPSRCLVLASFSANFKTARPMPTASWGVKAGRGWCETATPRGVQPATIGGTCATRPQCGAGRQPAAAHQTFELSKTVPAGVQPAAPPRNCLTKRRRSKRGLWRARTPFVTLNGLGVGFCPNRRN